LSDLQKRVQFNNDRKKKKKTDDQKKNEKENVLRHGMGKM